MALVSYSDSENSDSEPEATPVSQPKTQKPPAAPPPAQPSSASSAGGAFPSIVDRSNPRKIRVALPEIKPEKSTDPDGDDGPARKKPRTGGGAGGGLFAGFNSFLPAPKRAAGAEKDKKPNAAAARKVFSLKTGAAPGFDREADAEMRRDQALGLGGGGDNGEDETMPKAGSLATEGSAETKNNAESNAEEGAKEKPVEVKLKGNPMMFKPLSVGRTQQKKKKLPAKTTTTTTTTPTTTATTTTATTGANPTDPNALKEQAPPAPAAPKPKPKVSLFSLSSPEPDTAAAPSAQPTSTTYEPLVYNAPSEAPAAGPAAPEPQESGVATGPAETLDNIADDLNLSRAQRRQLFGRNAESSKSRVLHFNTDKEYIANQEMAHNTDLAAVQHNPVRPIAPGKHSLQQLVNAASNQREALEESFASGRRNKQEAGSKYGW